MTQPPRRKGRGRGRPKPSQISVLDREELLKALDSKDIVLKKSHIDGFYQALHRCHYPPLGEFVKQYYQNEKDATTTTTTTTPSNPRIGDEEDEVEDEVDQNNNDDDNNNNNINQKNNHNNYNDDAGKSSSSSVVVAVSGSSSSSSTSSSLPLKNAISNKKNRNRTSLPKSFLQFLNDPTNGFVTLTSKVAQVKTSKDGSTTKLAIQLHDGQLVESVLMRYGPKIGSTSSTTTTTTTTSSSSSPIIIEKSGRASLCVSSQVGCAMACNFCATGMMGLTGDLKYSEILEQVIHAERILGQEAIERRVLLQRQQQQQQQQQQYYYSSPSGKRNRSSKNSTDLDVVRNIVFMGMGEPLDNYTNVVEACRALIDRKRWNLAHGRVTVSTVGIASKIRKLTQELPEVSLALSLHAPNQTLRSKIVPTAKHYPIEDMIDALDGHMKAASTVNNNNNSNKNKKQASQSQNAANDDGGGDDSNANTNNTQPVVVGPAKGSSSVGSRRRAMIEYVMLEGETSTLQCAHELGELCKGKKLVVNLIPYNQTDVRDKLRCPSMEHIKEFQRIVASYGTFCTIRRTMGADIDSACGQLVVLENKNKEKKELRWSESEKKEEAAAADKSKDVVVDVVPDIEDSLPSNSSNNGAVGTKVGVKKKSQQQSASSVVKKEEELNPIGAEEAHPITVEDGLEKWIRPLQIATTIAASCFVVTSALYMKQRKR